MSKIIPVNLSDEYAEILDRLAEQVKADALFKKAGHKADVIRILLDVAVSAESQGVGISHLIRNDYIIRQVNP